MKEGNTKDIDLSSVRFKILAYGPPGAGKTYFSSTAPKPYFISTDMGLNGLAVRGLEVPYVHVETWHDVVSAVEQIHSGRRAQGCETIVIDHFTDLTPLVKDATMSEANKSTMNEGLWAVAKDKLRNLVHTFTSLSDKKGLHTIIIAHEKVEKNELRGGIWGTPNTIGQFSYQMGGWFDLYLYFRQEVRWQNGKQSPSWSMHSVNYVDFVAKDRLGILEPTENNTFDTIMERWKEKTDART